MFTQKLNTLTPGSNFQIFYAAFTQRNLGVVSSTLLVTLTHLQINMFLFQSFYQAFPIDQAVLEVLDDLTHYFYMGNIIELNKTLYYAFRIIAWIISISYFLVYLLMQLCFHKNYRIQSLERLFTLYNTYYANLLLLPSMEILFKEVVCDQTILEPLDQECLAGAHIFVFVISFLSIVAGLGMSFLSIFYSQNGIYDKKNYLSGENRGYEGSIALIKAILGVTVTIQNNSTALEQVYYVVNLATSLAIVLYFGYFFPYNKLFIEQVTLFWLAVYLAQSVAMVISCFTDITDLMAGLPFLGFLIATVVGLNFLYKQRKDSLIFKPTVSSNSELQKKVQNILQLKQSDRLQTNQELYFRGVVSTHMTSCIDPGCFCKKSELFDPKKNKNLELEKWGMYKSMTLKYYVSFLFEQQIQKGGSDPDLLIAYAQFLFEKFRNTHLALTQIIKVTNAGIFLYPHQRNKIFKIRRRIYEYVGARNQEALEVSLGIEDAIFVEDQFHSVLDQMRKIMQASIGFWGYLSGKEVDLDQMQILVETLTKSVETANVMWGPLKPYLHKNKKVMFYYNWYLKEFLNKRVMLSEEGVDELFDDEKCSIHSQDFISLIPNDNLIFHDDTPIVHMSGNYTDLGKIIKVNKATLNVFGYTRDELERASVNILMPKITAQRHNYYLECFARTGRSKTLYTQKKTFAKDKEGYIFRLWIIVKQLNNLQGLIQYVGILRPMSEKKDGHNYYMQFNDYGEVGGVCRNFASYFGQIEPQFQNKRFNLVIFAPKLIKYLFFRQFMLDQKEKELGFDQAQSPNSKYGILDAETDSPGGLRLQDTPKSASMKKKKKNAAENNETRLYELQDFLDLDALPEDEEEKDNESDQEKAVVYTSKNEKIIEFTFRLPSKSDVWIKEFDELKTRPQTLVNSHHLGENKLLMMNSFDSSRSLLERPPGETIRPAAVTAFSSSKHAFDSYLTALKIVSHKIAKAKNSHVYKMKAVLGVDKNGPDDDIVKYLKITEIQKVSHRKTTIDSSNQSPDKNKEFRSFNSNGSFSEVQKEVHKEHRDPTERRQKRDPSVKPIKMSLFSNNRGDNLVIKKIDVSDIESMESDNETAALENGERPSKHSKLEQKEIIDDDASDGDKSEITPRSKSSKGDDQENGSQGSSESIKQAVITELKNTLITQFQSMYQKEENMLIDKDCRSLRRLRWCTYLLFLTIIPINLIFFLVSTNNAFNHLDDAVTDVYTNERLRKDFLSAHDAILTLLLNNTDGFVNITTVSMSEINELVNSEITVIDTTHDEIAALAPQDQWTEVLYKYAPLVEQNAVLNYADNYEFSQQTTTIQIAFWKMANSLEDITLYNISDFQQDDSELVFYIWNCLPMFSDVFYRTSVKLFASISSSFDNTKSLAIWCLVTEGVTLVASLVIIFILVTVVTQSLKEILLSFTAIDNQSIRETEAYYKRLLSFFNISQAKYVENDSSKIPIKNNTNSGMLAKQNTNTNKFEKKFKKVLEKTFMKNYTRKILAYYVVATIICIVMLGVFDFEIHSTLSYADTMLSDVQQIVQLNTVYITSLIGLKSMFLNTTAYQEVTQGFLSGTISVLGTTLNTSSIQSTSSFGDLTRVVYGGKVCDTLTSLFFNDEEIEECRSLGLGKLSTGLVSFHNYYGNLVVPALKLTDPTFGIIDIDSIYEFGELIKIIDSVLFDTMLESWKGDMESYMDSQSRILTVLIIVLNLVNAIIFYWAQRGVLKSLNTKFLFYRKVYNRYMLADALIKEKRIKARLMKFRLLNK